VLTLLLLFVLVLVVPPDNILLLVLVFVLVLLDVLVLVFTLLLLFVLVLVEVLVFVFTFVLLLVLLDVTDEVESVVPLVSTYVVESKLPSASFTTWPYAVDVIRNITKGANRFMLSSRRGVGLSSLLFINQ